MWQSAASLWTGVAAAASRLFGRPRPVPLEDRLLALPEVEAVRDRGYEIVIHRAPAAKQYQPYIIRACRNGRTVGRLDIDFIGARRCLYVANIHVTEAHGNRGVGTALLVYAATATACTVLTTSSRTRQGARFFAKNRPVMKRYGVEMRDKPPPAFTPAPSISARVPASPSAAR